MVSSRSPNLTDKHVGNRVRARRLMIKMSQTELSRALGVSWQAVQKYETGENRIGASRLQQISNILQVSPGYFFEGAPDFAQGRTRRKEPPLPDYVTGFLATRDGVALAKAFTRVKNVELRRRIVRLIVELMGKI
jgi:transcriptional regulator with XRE-family HTH domain